MRVAVCDDDLVSALRKTGFPLEHRLTQAFRAANWAVMSSRYYVDETEGKARELDMIAYKVSKTEDLEVFTAVLISCKKDSENTWAFLSRPRPAVDPNITWTKVHCWTDVEPLSTFLKNSEWVDEYQKQDDRVKKFALDVKSDVFAMQAVSPAGEQQVAKRKDATPPPAKAASARDDKDVFKSVAGLLTALDYELNALKDRVANKDRLYVFHQAVVVDAPLVVVDYSGTTEKCRKVDHLLHLARYMVKRQHMEAIVHFVSSDKIEWFVSELSHVASIDKTFFPTLIRAANDSFPANKAVNKYVQEKLFGSTGGWINSALIDLGVKDRVTAMGIAKSRSGLYIELDVFLGDAAEEKLNEDQFLKDLISLRLRQLVGYEGAFRLHSEIPF